MGIGRVELRLLEAGSLKAKRHVVKGLLGGLQSKFRLAAAEVDHQDLWQRSSLGISCVSESSFHARKVLQEAERWVGLDHRVEVLSFDSYVVAPED